MTRAVSIAVEDVRVPFPRAGFELRVDCLKASAGQAIALLGPSGSGKTTLLQVMGLLTRPASGRVLLDGKPVTPADRNAVTSMAAVFQRPYLFKGSVGGNVGYGLTMRGIRGAEQRKLVEEALERVRLAGFARRSALELSGGEAQRVSLARALVLQPRVLLLDEPLASLDPLLKRRLIRDFAEIVGDADATVVYVTHDQDEALVVADSIAVLNAGRVVASGPAEEVYGLVADDWTAAFLGVPAASSGTAVSTVEGLTSVLCGSVLVSVAGSIAEGTPVQIAVRPEDVLLFAAHEELPAGSARNRMVARVSLVEQRGSTVHVGLETDGLGIAASVSRAAAAELGLVPGSEVLAVFKATAVRWRIVDRLEEPRMGRKGAGDSSLPVQDHLPE